MKYPKLEESCYACGAQGNYSILLSITGERVYLPNQITRNPPVEMKPNFREVPFCAECMRKVEDNLRATIQYLQSEHG